MGLLSPVCYASDGNKLYGYGFSGTYDQPNLSYNYLIVSNNNPAPDLSDLTWTLLSTISRDSLYYLFASTYYDGQAFNCAVDDRGVFTIIARDSLQYLGAAIDSKRGLQYQPPDNGITTSSTNGTWKNFDVINPDVYNWPNGDWSQLAVFKDPTTGNNTVMHLTNQFLDDGFYVATLNETSMWMTQSSLWGWVK